jgi:AraC family L-rhamnose operon regulatory protein RhaS
MLELSVYNKFNLVVCDSREWEKVQSQYDFFKIAFVLEGKGTLVLKGDVYTYEKDSFFLIGPGVNHSFSSKEKTRLFVITVSLLASGKTKRKPTNISPYYDLLKQVETIFSHRNFTQGKVIENATDRKFTSQLIEQIAFEMQHRPDSYKAVIKSSVFLLVHVVTRNIEDAGLDEKNDYKWEVDQIIQYIKEHIHDNQKLKIEVISNKFGLSPDCINENLRVLTGSSLKKYILNYKTDLFKSRLLHIDVNEFQRAPLMKEIPAKVRAVTAF